MPSRMVVGSLDVNICIFLGLLHEIEVGTVITIGANLYWSAPGIHMAPDPARSGRIESSPSEARTSTSSLLFPSSPPHPKLTMAQVIVVGGGLAGLSAAHTLLERGANVLLLDKQP